DRPRGLPRRRPRALRSGAHDGRISGALPAARAGRGGAGGARPGAAMSGALATEVVRDPERLAALAPEWWALWARAPTATPFQSPAWLLPWWRHFSPGRLMSIAVWQHQRLVALAPLYLEENPGGARLLPLGISLSDYLDLLLDPDASAPAAAALAERLAAERAAWRRCDLEELEP